MGITQPQGTAYQATESSQTPSGFPLSGPTCRSPNQRQKFLELLRQNGKAGVLTSDSLRIPIARYSSRIRECRQMGYEISTERITEGCFKYVLIREPLTPKELPSFQPRRKQTAQEHPPLFAEVGR
jgi:hypothetical protein